MQLNRDVLDDAVGKWRDILLSLGIDPKYLQNRHGPCPICAGGTDRYRFDDKMQRGNWFCNHCGSGDGVQLLRGVYGWGFVQCKKEVERVMGTARLAPVRDEKSDEEKKQAMHALLREARVVTMGDPVWKYLNGRTGITIVPRDIWYHPSLYHTESQRKYPAMLATLRYANGNGASVHRTYLDGKGGKASVESNKKMWPGLPINGSCVRLSEIEALIGIAEGIETAFAASMRFGFPVWAATSAPVLEKWEPPKGIREVVICGDNDTSYAGQAAAYNLAKRLRTKGYPVRVEIPDPEDSDWADVIEAGNPVRSPT